VARATQVPSALMKPYLSAGTWRLLLPQLQMAPATVEPSVLPEAHLAVASAVPVPSALTKQACVVLTCTASLPQLQAAVARAEPSVTEQTAVHAFPLHPLPAAQPLRESATPQVVAVFWIAVFWAATTGHVPMEAWLLAAPEAVFLEK